MSAMPPFARYVNMVATIRWEPAPIARQGRANRQNLSTGEPVAMVFMDGLSHSIQELELKFPDISYKRIQMFLSRFKRNGFFVEGQRRYLTRIESGRYVMQGKP